MSFPYVVGNSNATKGRPNTMWLLQKDCIIWAAYVHYSHQVSNPYLQFTVVFKPYISFGGDVHQMRMKIVTSSNCQVSATVEDRELV